MGSVNWARIVEVALGVLSAGMALVCVLVAYGHYEDRRAGIYKDDEVER